MKAVKKKPVQLPSSLNKSMRDFSSTYKPKNNSKDLLNRPKATGGLEPNYPVFDAIAGAGLVKPLKAGAKTVVKKAFGKATKKKPKLKNVLKLKAAQGALTAKDVNEFTK